jgi:signal transduction histidine kinase
MPEPLPERDLRFYRRLRWRTTGAIAVLVFLPLTVFYLLAPAEVRQRTDLLVACIVPALVAGLVLAFAGGEMAVHYAALARTAVRKALETAAYREHERDLAQEELVRRLHQERELAHEKMQFEAQLAAYEKYAALAQLALGAAHEVNNPLLGILSHLELERKLSDDPEMKEEIEQCIQGTRRISTTIRGLLNYARPGPLLLTRISLDRLVDDTFAFLSHQPLFRGKKLEKRIAPELPAITADSNQLSQILMNLLLNAAEATPEGGAITVTAAKVKFTENLEIAVSDTGCGIPADILPHVLEPFFTTKRGSGTGLGLSICHAYVRSHGGDLQVESIPNQGTTVRITLPVRQEGRMVQETEEVVA